MRRVQQGQPAREQLSGAILREQSSHGEPARGQSFSFESGRSTGRTSDGRSVQQRPGAGRTNGVSANAMSQLNYAVREELREIPSLAGRARERRYPATSSLASTTIFNLGDDHQIPGTDTTVQFSHSRPQRRRPQRNRQHHVDCWLVRFVKWLFCCS